MTHRPIGIFCSNLAEPSCLDIYLPVSSFIAAHASAPHRSRHDLQLDLDCSKRSAARCFGVDSSV